MKSILNNNANQKSKKRISWGMKQTLLFDKANQVNAVLKSPESIATPQES